MKKRSMLAVASLAAGVVASLLAPSAHAGTPDQGAGTTGPQTANSVLDTVTGEAGTVAAEGTSALGPDTLRG
ncbi:hypothetical protein [Kitasatospora sp. NPDC057015]|uniref:hypothetical protein n=1 Tax=Kitasatospora sp. NPDC057015 TaxID=3346001 RepID=UPI0036295E21